MGILILHLQKGIASCWLLRIISLSEAVSLKNMTHKNLVEFITEHIIHRFSIPQTLVTDQGSSFISKEVPAFAKSCKIKLLNSSPYSAQGNGQAESSNKILIKLIKKKIEKKS